MIRCPVHDTPDCSPLLNGCSRVNELHREVQREAQDMLDRKGETFTAVCTKIGRRAGVLYSTWKETNVEGIQTEITFRYPDCESIGDQVDDEITLTLHLDSTGRAIVRNA